MYKTHETGKFTIDASQVFNFPENVNIYLEDKKEGIVQDLRKEPVYTCKILSNEITDRFIIRFTKPETNSDAIHNQDSIINHETENNTTIKTDSARLSNFIGKKENNIIGLKWKITNGKDLDHIEIERSIDGELFETIETIKINNDEQNTEYKYSDNYPYNEDNYYRLKQVYNNGNYKYSSPIKIMSEENMNMKIYPNPSDGQNINIKLDKRHK